MQDRSSIAMTAQPHTGFRRASVANRSDIAIRALRAAVELGIGTIAIHPQEDPFAPYRIGPGVQT